MKKNSVQAILQERWDLARSKRPGYSLRSFARQAGLSPASLSLVLAGKRTLSEKTCLRVAAKLHLTPAESEKLLSDLRKRSPLSAEYVQLRMDDFYLIAEWYHYALLALLSTEGFRAEIPQIASRLGISRAQAREALERLERLGLLAKGPDGAPETTGKSYTTSNDVADLALQRSHLADLDLAKESIRRDPVDLRDISSIVMPVDPGKIPQAKKMIRNFRRRLAKLMETGTKSEVYQISIQLFPLSKQETLP